MAIGDIDQLIAVQELDGQTVLNTHYYQHLLASTNTFDSANAFIATVIPAYKATQSESLDHLRVTAAHIFPIPRTIPIFPATGAGAGTLLGPALPAQNAIVISKRTPLAGPRWRGRWYVSGAREMDVDEGQLTAAALPTWQALATALGSTLSHMGTPAFLPVHQVRLDPPPAPPAHPFSYNGLFDTALRSIVRAQRRRQVQRGI